MRKFLAFVIALFIAVPMLIAAFFLISIRPWVLDRDFYKKALTDDRLYSALRSAPTADPAQSIEIGGFSFDAKAFQAGLSASLPAEELKKLSVKTVDGVFDALEGKPGADSIDLGALKASVKANEKKFVSAYVEALPEGGEDKSSVGDFSVLPKGVSRSKYAAALAPVLQNAIDGELAKAKPSISLEPVKRSREKMPFAKNLGASYAISMFGYLACALAVWVMAGMLWPKPWSSRLPFMGGFLIFSSLLVILIGVLGMIAVNYQSMTQTMQALGAPAWTSAAGQGAEIKAYFASLAATMTRGFFITGLVAASIGAGLVSLRWVAAAREI